jgi:hypothetical protein
VITARPHAFGNPARKRSVYAGVTEGQRGCGRAALDQFQRRRRHRPGSDRSRGQRRGGVWALVWRLRDLRRRGPTGCASPRYLCALQADTGEDPIEVMYWVPSPLREAVRVDGTAGTFTIDPARRHMLFYGDSDTTPSTADEGGRRRRCRADCPASPEAGCGQLGSQPPAWHRVPSTFVVCSNDNALQPGVQRQMAKHAAETIVWDSDDSPFLTRPEAVADLLARYAAG